VIGFFYGDTPAPNLSQVLEFALSPKSWIEAYQESVVVPFHLTQLRILRLDLRSTQRLGDVEPTELGNYTFPLGQRLNPLELTFRTSLCPNTAKCAQ
jgi:hypothetical protein